MEWYHEDEAQRLLCPLMSFVADRKCCTSECAAWTWRDHKNTADKHGTCAYLQRRYEQQPPERRWSR